MRSCIVLLERHPWMSCHKRKNNRTKIIVDIALSSNATPTPRSKIKDDKWCPLLITYPALYHDTRAAPTITFYDTRISTALASFLPYPHITIAHFKLELTFVVEQHVSPQTLKPALMLARPLKTCMSMSGSQWHSYVRPWRFAALRRCLMVELLILGLCWPGVMHAVRVAGQIVGKDVSVGFAYLGWRLSLSACHFMDGC